MSRVDRGAILIQSEPGVLRSLGPPPSGEHARDRPKYRSVRSELLSSYGHLGEDDDANAKMVADTSPFLNLKLSRDCRRPPPTLTRPLSSVEQNAMQRPISVKVWDIEPSPLYPQPFEINEERDWGQEVEGTASALVQVTFDLTAGCTGVAQRSTPTSLIPLSTSWNLLAVAGRYIYLGPSNWPGRPHIPAGCKPT